MKNFRRIVTYKFYQDLSKHAIAYIKMQLSEIDGIISFEVLPESVTIDCICYKLYEEAVKKIFQKIDYKIKIEVRKRPRILTKQNRF